MATRASCHEIQGQARSAPMPSPPRHLGPGLHHVWVNATGNERYYLDNDDRIMWVRLLTNVLDRLGWKCVAFCQLSTHVHSGPTARISTPVMTASGNSSVADTGAGGSWTGAISLAPTLTSFSILSSPVSARDRRTGGGAATGRRCGSRATSRSSTRR